MQLAQAVYDAANDRDVAMLCHLLCENAPTDYADAEGNTALHVAVQNLDTECVELLLKAGSDFRRANSVSVETTRRPVPQQSSLFTVACSTRPRGLSAEASMQREPTFADARFEFITHAALRLTPP